jgi:hypothetical protein
MNKRLICGLLLLFSAVLIVRPVIGSVNVAGGNSGLVASSAKPEGDPMPPPSGPHNPSAALLTADGNPMPGPGGPHSPARMC